MEHKPGGKPEIQYPCLWQFRLIGEDRDAILEAIGAAVNGRRCRITDGNVSSGGRYRTLHLELTVQDEAERLQLQEAFSRHPAIRVVL